MKLPDIKYTTGVQTLGRHDISAPGRTAMARSGAATAVAKAVSDMQDTWAVIEYTNLIGQAKTDMTDLYTHVTSKEQFTQDEIPDYVNVERFEKGYDDQGNVVDVEREFIPASEIREDWFKKGIQNISQSVLGNAKTGPARQRLKLELTGSIGPAAYAQMQKYNLTALKSERKAQMEMAVQQGVVDGDRIGVEATLMRYKEAGLITVAEYQVRQLRASQELDIESYTQDIFAAEDAGDLAEIDTDLSLNLSPTTPGKVQSDMTPAQRRSIRQSISIKQAMIDDVRKRSHVENEQEGVRLGIQGALTDNWLIDMSINDGLEGPALRSLDNMRDTAAGRTVVRNSVVSSHQDAIQKAMYYPEFGIQVTDITDKLNISISRNTSLEGAEKVILFDYVRKIEKNIRDNPEYGTALVVMRSVTGLPEDEEALRSLMRSKRRRTPTEILAMKAYADFKTSLFMYIDEFGAEANVLEFVERNKDRYDYVTDPKRVRTIETSIENSPYSGYLGLGPVPFNAEYVIRSAYKDWNSGILSDEELFDIWNILYKDSVDIQFLEDL